MRAAKQDAQVLYSSLTFRILLDTLARPGKIAQLSSPDFLGEIPALSSEAKTSLPLNAYALGALLTLLDRETSFSIATNGQWLQEQEPLMQWLMLRTSAQVAAAEQATFALFCDQESIGLATSLSVGTLLEPEASATAFYCLEHLIQPGAQIAEDGFILELRGPGIADTQMVILHGLSETTLKRIVASRRGYPLGVDVYLIDTSGRCIGLPRTTRITWTGLKSNRKEG